MLTDDQKTQIDVAILVAPGQTARDLAKLVDASRKEVNRFLYKDERYVMSTDYKWSISQ